jgi:hypothetical protein
MLGLTALGALWLAIGAGSFMLMQPMTASATDCQPPAVDPSRLQQHVRALAIEFHPRSWDEPENIERTARYISERFSEAGGRVSEQPFEIRAGDSYKNILARFGPEDGERIVVGAHYDAARGTPGADDNASGVAGLIELAFLLARQPPPVPVELVAWTLEEPPFFRTDEMGSAHHAAQLRRQGAKVRGVIALEMLGVFSDAPGSQRFPVPGLGLLYPTRGNFIAVVGGLSHIGLVRKVKRAMRGASDLPVHSINAPGSLPGVDFSDHASYWRQGFDAVMITDTAFFRNQRYHTEQDTPDTLDYPRMAKVVQGVFCAVQALAR